MADKSQLANIERLDIARQFLAHIGRRDVEQTVSLMSENVTYRVLGEHALAGTFSGQDAVAGHLVGIVDLTSGRFDAVKTDDWMLGQQHVGVLVNIHMETTGTRFTGRDLILLRFDIEDKIDEVMVFSEDPDAARRFYGPKHESA